MTVPHDSLDIGEMMKLRWANWSTAWTSRSSFENGPVGIRVSGLHFSNLKPLLQPHLPVASKMVFIWYAGIAAGSMM
ncbi:hypothetical protein HZ326_25077 [Fusarium oxysporum f. sp. albedinis]|nr:hypothetical protein HZ326_25077 [Fusarium oxysporum f. sp. albedinis]